MGDTIRRLTATGYSSHRPARARPAVRPRCRALRRRLRLHLHRISGRHRIADDHEGTSVDQLGGKFLGDGLLHVVAPRVWTLGDFTRTMAVAIIAPMFWPNPPAIAANPVGNSIRASTGHPFVQRL